MSLCRAKNSISTKLPSHRNSCPPPQQRKFPHAPPSTKRRPNQLRPAHCSPGSPRQARLAAARAAPVTKPRSHGRPFSLNSLGVSDLRSAVNFTGAGEKRKGKKRKKKEMISSFFRLCGEPLDRNFWLACSTRQKLPARIPAHRKA